MFNNIIHQESAKTILKHAINSNRVAQGYLLSGYEGTGKMLTAMTLAKVLNCLSDIKPCNTCNSCIKINNFSHPDVKYYFPIPNYDMDINGGLKSNSDLAEYQEFISSKINTPWRIYNFDKPTAIRIEQIRALQNDISMARFEGKVKVYIIEGFETLTIAASNSFLKTLEEPPPNTVFILLTSHKEKILPTILSRVIVIDFFPIPTEKIEDYLRKHFTSDDTVAKLNAHLANGNLERAITLTTDGNISSIELLIDFLNIILSKDDERFVAWLESHVGKEKKSTKDQFKLPILIQFLYIWVNDVKQFSLNTGNLVFINHVNLIAEFSKRNDDTDALLNVLYKLDEYQQKFSGNVNSKLILVQIYDTFKNVF